MSQPRPSQGQLAFPLLETIQGMGGRAAAIDVADALADRFDLSVEDRARTTRTGDGQIVNVWRRHVRFARQKAVAMGYIGSDRRGGSWNLTDAGYKGLDHASSALVVEILTNDAGEAVAARINLAVGVPTTHLIATGDSRDLSWIGDGEIPLVVTSAPYFDIKDYGRDPGQLAEMPSYDAFLDALDDVWRECMRVLIPGGRMAVNVGDVLRSRSKHGEHHVLPLHADILARSTRMGFRSLNGIVWSKIGTCNYEQGPGGILGKPGQPNGIIQQSLEHILLFRKPGPYRSPSFAQQRDSAISKAEHGKWFRQIWEDVPGARAVNGHPAPFPIEIPYRLIRMFSFAGDGPVLDPFGGSGTTSIAAAKAGRDSVLVDVSSAYVRNAIERVQASPARELGMAA